MVFFSFSLIQQVFLFETNGFEDNSNLLLNRRQTFDLVQKQQNDEVIPKMISRKIWGNPHKIPNLPIALRKLKKV